jgi:hypothetical protein
MLQSIDPAWQVEVQERAPSFAQAFADGLGEGQIRLTSPGCPKGCNPCFRECAVRHIMADWWTRELAEVQSAAGRGLSHDGVVYTVRGRAH